MDKLREQMETYQSLARSLHEQLKTRTQERDTLKMNLLANNELIKILRTDVEQRDKLIAFYSSQNSALVQPKEKEGNKNEEMTFEMLVDGNNGLFDFQNKQPSPFDSMMQQPTRDTSFVAPEEKRNDPKSKLASTSSTSSSSREKRSSSRAEEESRHRHRHRSSSSSSQSTKTTKRPKTSEEPTTRDSSKRTLESEGRFSKGSSQNKESKPRQEQSKSSKNEESRHRFQEQKNSSNADNNVLNIPENLRYNFGTCDRELGVCEVGQKFWFDQRNIHVTKFFLKLHSDREDWESKTLFILKEQYGLSQPIIHRLKFDELKFKLETTPNKRIWLDARDFDIFSPSAQNIFGDSIEKSISHFSLGDRCYSDRHFSSSLVLKFILKLVNIEYLSVNNATLANEDDIDPDNNTTDNGNDIEPEEYIGDLPKLKTIRLIHLKLETPLQFITQLVESSKNFDHFYGFPLNRLKEPVGQKVLETGTLRSVFIRRDYYSASENSARNFVRDLNNLARHQKCDVLDEFDMKTFFLECKASTLSVCLDRLSEIMKKHANFLAKLKLEFCASSLELKIPQLKKLKALHLNMNHDRRFEHSDGTLSFFPKNFDIKANFPSLSKVELYMEFANGVRQNFHNLPEIMFEKYFPQETFRPGVSFDQVECLTLHGFVVLDLMSKVADLFPNLKRLCLHDNLTNICKVLPFCYRLWKNLNQLTVEASAESFSNLDSALTGLSEKMCQDLRYKPDREKIQYSLNQNGNGPSIFHLTDLEILKINLRPAAHRQFSKAAVITAVGALGLSQLLKSGEKRKKEFKLQIGFDERVFDTEKQYIISALSPILPFPFVVLER